MKGIIFNTVEETVGEIYGPDTWDDLIDAAGVSGSYTSLGTYPDEELVAIVGAACQATDMSASEILEALGRKSFDKLVTHVPDLVDKDKGAFHFLSTVHDIIHVEVAKLVPEAKTPDVITREIDETTMEVSYTSQRRMGALARGLMLGAGDYFGETLTVESETTEGNTTVFVISKGNEG